jgi:MFS family permease
VSRKQLVALFLCSIVPWTVGNGLVPLLPVYAASLGASEALSGLYLAVCYLGLALGALSAGALSERLGRRKLPLLIAGIASIPLTWGMGRAANVWQLTVLTVALWFLGGLGFALINILAGLQAGEDERGRVFGILGLASGVGALIGGLGTGAAVDRWGFSTMLAGLALFVTLWPLSSLLLREVRAPRRPEQTEIPDAPAPARAALGRGFWLLLGASLASGCANFVAVLGRSIEMNGLAFPALAIAGIAALSAAITMPLTAGMARLSDRLGRKRFLVAGGLLGVAGLAVLLFSTALWQFGAASVLLSLAVSLVGSVGSAWITDLVPRAALGRAMALSSATGWVAGILGFLAGGQALQHLGVAAAYGVAIGLMGVALVLIVPIRGRA